MAVDISSEGVDDGTDEDEANPDQTLCMPEPGLGGIRRYVGK